MESWMVMGAILLLLCVFHPPFLGLVAGAGGVMLLTVVLSKIFGG
jgi:hypothetical protein